MAKQTMVFGVLQSGNGKMVLLPGKDRQFAVVLEDVGESAAATVKVYACPDGTTSRRVDVATLELAEGVLNEVTPILESLIDLYYAEVVSVTDCAVSVFGMSEG